jgi:hypothetical protein
MTLDVLSNTPQWKEWPLRHRLLSSIRIGDTLKSSRLLRPGGLFIASLITGWRRL